MCRRITTPPAAGWQDIPLPWIANCGDYDVFGRNDGFVAGEFVLRCTQAGVTDWDNNGGANYQLGNFQNVTGGNVALNKATARQRTQAGRRTSPFLIPRK